jgi:hypothetical protein
MKGTEKWITQTSASKNFKMNAVKVTSSVYMLLYFLSGYDTWKRNVLGVK